MTVLPSMIQVGPLRFTAVIDQKTVDKERKDSNTSGVIGFVRRHTQEIFIAEDVAADQQAVALLHEILHAIYGQFDVDAKIDDEATVSITSGVLLDTMRRNPDLVAYLMGE